MVKWCIPEKINQKAAHFRYVGLRSIGPPTQVKSYGQFKFCCIHICIAWLSLNFLLETSWVALYSDVCLWGIGVTRPNLHFLQYIQAYKPFADHVPPNSKQYQLILTKYQPVSSYTDPVPSSTTYNSSSPKAQFSQLNNLSFYNSFDESRTVCMSCNDPPRADLYKI